MVASLLTGLPVVEPAVVHTRYISGILPPVYDGRNWLLTFVETRQIDGEWCRVVIDRYAMSERDLIGALNAAMKPLAERLKPFVPIVVANGNS